MYAVYSFLSDARKIKKAGLYLQQARNTLALNPQLFCQQIAKKHTLVKGTAKYVFS